MRLIVAVVAGSMACGAAVAGPREDLIAAFGKAMERGAYRAEIDAAAGGRKVRTSMEVQWPDRYHMKTEGTEMIILPGTTWMNANGQWMAMPMDMSRTIQGYTKQAMDQGVQGIGEVSVVGDEDIDGCSSTLYRYRASGEFMGVKSESEAEVAVCSSNGLPVRMTSKDKGGDTVVVRYDFEAEVNIQAPK